MPYANWNLPALPLSGPMPHGSGVTNCVHSAEFGLIVLQRGEHQRGAVGEAVAQLHEVADVRVLAAVRVVQAALVEVMLERERAVAGALRVQQRDAELADRAGLADLIVVAVEGAVGRRELRLPRLRGLQRAEVDGTAERAGLRAEAHAGAGEQVGVDRAQVRRRARRAERDAVERDRRLRLVVAAQRDRLRRVRIVRVLRDVDAADGRERVGERVGDAAHGAGVVDVCRHDGDARAHRADDLQPAGVGGWSSSSARRFSARRGPRRPRPACCRAPRTPTTSRP